METRGAGGRSQMKEGQRGEKWLLWTCFPSALNLASSRHLQGIKTLRKWTIVTGSPSHALTCVHAHTPTRAHTLVPYRWEKLYDMVEKMFLLMFRRPAFHELTILAGSLIVPSFHFDSRVGVGLENSIVPFISGLSEDQSWRSYLCKAR